jgi:hypothetical protein
MLENNDMKFDPFEDRACRDIRNHLGQQFINALNNKSMVLCLNDDLLKTVGAPPHIQTYMDKRRKLFNKILALNYSFCAEANSNCPENCDQMIGGLLWNHHLFFEFHEWVEEKWHQADGDTKKALQALVLAAVAFEHFTYDRLVPAKRLAIKACQLFEQFQNLMPGWVESKVWTTHLSAPEMTPFTILNNNFSNKRSAR